MDFALTPVRKMNYSENCQDEQERTNSEDEQRYQIVKMNRVQNIKMNKKSSKLLI